MTNGVKKTPEMNLSGTGFILCLSCCDGKRLESLKSKFPVNSWTNSFLGRSRDSLMESCMCVVVGDPPPYPKTPLTRNPPPTLAWHADHMMGITLSHDTMGEGGRRSDFTLRRRTCRDRYSLWSSISFLCPDCPAIETFLFEVAVILYWCGWEKQGPSTDSSQALVQLLVMSINMA